MPQNETKMLNQCENDRLRSNGKFCKARMSKSRTLCETIGHYFVYLAIISFLHKYRVK